MYILSDYDKNLKRILNEGFEIQDDRTGVGTRCLFGLNSEFDISERVPVLTKRKIFWRSIVKEVLWYISGSHNINDLEKEGCGIWTPWKNDQFTSKHNLPQGSGGYIYGFNLIHFGANIQEIEEQKRWGTYVEGSSMNGFNQLDYVINTLRANPKSRQACFTFWRPDTNHQAILPACHAMYSFIVSPDVNGEMNILNCHMFQRSADYPIGVGAANLFIASLFVYMIAQQLNMKPGTLYHSSAHSHIYLNAIDATTEYCDRTETIPSPILKINKKPSIYDYTIEDFELSEYNPLPTIKFPLAV